MCDIKQLEILAPFKGVPYPVLAGEYPIQS